MRKEHQIQNLQARFLVSSASNLFCDRDFLISLGLSFPIYRLVETMSKLLLPLQSLQFCDWYLFIEDI